MSIWKTDELGKFVTLKRGYDLPQQKRVDGAVPIFSSSGVTGTHKESMVNAPGVITGRYGTIGEVFFSKEPFWPLNTTLYVENFHGNDERFIYYFLKSLKWEKFTSASAVPGINRNTVHKEIVEIPDLESQRKIAAVLSAFDDKIDINQRINDNLEQQLHQLFIQTFNGCDTNISLGKVVKTTSGGTPARKHREYYSNGTINWVKSKELTGQYLFDTEESLTSLGVAMSSAKILPAHSVLIAMYGATVGEHSITTKEMACNQAICALLENKDYPYTYLFQIAKENQQNLVNLAIGSAQQNISQILLKQLSVHSDVATIHQYHCLALPLHKEIELLQSENRLLNTTRDALLPELMTGELDLSSVDF